VTFFPGDRGGENVIDIVSQLNATHREIGTHPVATGEGRSVHLRRVYDYAVDDVWDACTDRDRIARWLAPVDGDLRVGGNFQLEGNAGGEILRCEKPGLLHVTWVLGEGMATEVEVRLATDSGGGTLFELVHSAPAAVVDEMARAYGPGVTIGIGGGWDLSLLGLDLHLAGTPFDPATAENDPEVKEFATRCCHAWGAAVQAAWGTSDEDTAAGVAFAVQNFAPQG
jgi:uncharacterized protein YndB with AHSA1/START domain